MAQLTRRNLLQAAAVTGTTLAAGATATLAAESHASPTVWPDVRYCLNTSTIAGHRGKIPLVEEIKLIHQAGYTGIEPWMREIQSATKGGTKLAEIRKRLDDSNVRVESAIGFANWIVDDDAKRKKALEDLKRDMDLVSQLGGTRMAAPPAGASGKIDLDRAAERYLAALEVGKKMGVTPMLELWGHSKALHGLGQIMYIAVESGSKDAEMLLDVYHIYKGGSSFEGLGLVDGRAVKVLHMNDYPNIVRPKIKDADRVFPGDGVAPVSNILKSMRETGFNGVLSLELFNPTYWEQDAKKVLAKGIASMKAAVAGMAKI